MGDLPGWMSGAGKKRNINRRSKKQEKDHARKVEGKVQAGSGSSRRAPQDVISETFLDQLKFTDADGYRIIADELLAIGRDANQSGRTPRIIVDFQRHGIRLTGYIERIPDRDRR